MRDNLAAVPVDAQIDTREAHLYEKLNLAKWHSRQHTNQQQQQVTKINLTLEEYYQRYRHSENSLIHLRVHGTQPYILPKLNADRRTGRCDTTQREAIQLLPYQTFDLILPLPNPELLPHINAEPTRIKVVGHITSQSHPARSNENKAPTRELPFTIQEQIPNNRRDQQAESDTRGVHQNGGEDEAWHVRDSDEEHAMQHHPEKPDDPMEPAEQTKKTSNRHTLPGVTPCSLHITSSTSSDQTTPKPTPSHARKLPTESKPTASERNQNSTGASPAATTL